jgi:polyferredoxin
MRYIKIFVGVVSVSLSTAAFLFAELDFNWFLNLQPIPTAISVAFLILITVGLGRFFCAAMCPLGILQTVVNFVFRPKTHVKRVCTRLPETKMQKIVRWSIFSVLVLLGVLGYWGVVWFFNPYAIFGRAVALWVPGVIVFGVILALAAFSSGRIWCNWVCPVGTVLNLLSKISVFKDKVGKGCGNCRKCMKTSDESKAVADISETVSAGVSRRDTLKGVAVIAVAEKLTDGGFAEVSLPGVPRRPASVLPPGALPRDQFARKCVGCLKCLKACPEHVIVPSVKLKTFGQVELAFTAGQCLLGCDWRCGKACPTGAIRPLDGIKKKDVHIGHAIWKKDLCLRALGKEKCNACLRRCPVNAIKHVENAIVVDKSVCIGCGACEHSCPVRPMPAIFVKGFDRQRIVSKMGEGDLVAEMKYLIDEGFSVVVAKDGVIVERRKGSGIGPIVKLLDENKFEDATVVDKIVGRAAAAVFVIGKAKKVHAFVMSKGAEELLKKHGVECSAEKLTEKIINREKSDICPMEKAVSSLSDPEEMVQALKALQR